MDWRKFISESLTQIIKGINDAQTNIIELQKRSESDHAAP